ncbi:calcium-binding protein [Streptomyces sp. NPDC058067]|uniref:calcium-binding protein n=1 Tax=Streptomyces sp. NPDC058067 TaxID=3346324 RepID=UPI0036E8DA31
MRIRATVAASLGALALTAVIVPAAQAAGNSEVRAAASQATAHASKAASPKATAFSATGTTDDQQGDTAISNVVVNGGKDVVLGTTTKKTVTVTFTATDNSGIDTTTGYAVLYHGTDIDHSDYGSVPSQQVGDAGNCATTSATTATCTMTFTIDPHADLANAAAGSWKTWAIVGGKDGDYSQRENVKTFGMKRFSKLTTNAGPEPVAKGKTLTVTGSLTRANWDNYTYAGYTNQPVKLQFKKAGTTTYTTVKTVTSSSTGGLKTTVTAAYDGYWRYSFAGTSTTPAVTSASDYVDVR